MTKKTTKPQPKIDWKKRYENAVASLDATTVDKFNLIAQRDKLEADLAGLALVNGTLNEDIAQQKADIKHYIQAAGFWMNKWVSAVNHNNGIVAERMMRVQGYARLLKKYRNTRLGLACYRGVMAVVIIVFVIAFLSM